MDPFLHLIEDCKLQAADTGSQHTKISQLPIIREQLVNEFLPDDVCPLGAQFMDAPRAAHQFDSNDHKSVEEAGPAFTIDDDVLPESFGNQAKQNSEQAIENFDLLSVNQLLESVCYYCISHYFVAIVHSKMIS
ncbi:hypothetical protein U1Q18_040439 [Sarracenia purpurea var. burkii]